MLARADHVFVGVIQKHALESQRLFSWDLPGEDPDRAKYWKIARRQVRVELVLRGTEPRKVVDIYEMYWTGGTTGNWNSTRDGERDLFLVRVENGRYHVVRDWWRSIFPVTSGPHRYLPLDDSRPLWERIALMNMSVERNDETARLIRPYFRYSDPGNALSQWRLLKLERGLVRHPSASIRQLACSELLYLSDWGQDECWEMLSDEDRAQLSDSACPTCPANRIAAGRQEFAERGVSRTWATYRDRDVRRRLTAVSNQQMRAEFCHLWEREYPGDTDTGCPADRPPPATIVTERGDVPLLGPWPR